MPINLDSLKKKLIETGKTDEKTLNNLLELSKTKGISFEELIEEKGIFSEHELGEIMAGLYEVPYIRLEDQTIKDNLLPIVPYMLAAHQYLIPFEQDGDTLKLAINDPSNIELINFIENKTGLKVTPYYATKRDLKLALKIYNKDVNEKFNKLLKGAMDDTKKIESLEDASKIVDTIILFAYQNGASDIHLEPHKNFIMVRNRVDGILNTIAELPIEIMELVVTRIKVLSKLRTDEHRTAQDGRFKIELEGNEITLRVSILPTYDGEKVVMRLLTSDKQELKLESLGYSKENLEKINQNIKKTHGIILMTGPTGSGKTTTLYTILKMLNSTEVNISTIEDPIEYRLEGVNQTQVNRKTGLTFAAGLRALLRQDPNIIMVGEIRDEETGSVAINAALTGHLVLATLHTNDAVSSLPRLMEMGIENFLVAATAQMVIAQRLVRTICEHCKKPYQMSIKQLEDLGKILDKKNAAKIMEKFQQQATTSLTFWKGEGCEHCANTGYKGRLSIAEVLEVTDEIRKNISAHTKTEELEEIAKKEGMIDMFTDGLNKVISGMTTIEEVLRVMRD